MNILIKDDKILYFGYLYLDILDIYDCIYWLVICYFRRLENVEKKYYVEWLLYFIIVFFVCLFIFYYDGDIYVIDIKMLNKVI